jgi:hypothetical protein
MMHSCVVLISVENTSLPVLLRWMRAINFILAILMILAGFFGLFSFATGDVVDSLVGVYVILFGGLLLLFECRLKTFETSVRKYFGFMYSYRGRTLFLAFVAVLCFGLSVVGIVAGALTMAGALFNGYVIFRHPEFRSGRYSSKDDPTKGYTSGDKEALSAATQYMRNNPDAVKGAATAGVAWAQQHPDVASSAFTAAYDTKSGMTAV